ncbi:hypothetical protein BH11PSE7_BH11PSE7_20270 [soil metagenome]
MSPRTSYLLFGSALLALALRGMAAYAQAPSAPPGPRAAGTAALAMGDRVFIKEAAETARFEVDASQLALQNAASPKLRDFAGRLVRDHKASGAGLLRLAHARGLTPPMMTGAHRKTLNLLSRAHGAGFDRVYLEKVGLQSRRDSINGFEMAGNQVRDAELKRWIDATLPMLREQLAQAQMLAARR